MVRVVLAAVAILLGSRVGVAEESCDGEASSLLQTAGRSAATTAAVARAESHSRRKSAHINATSFSTSDDACLGCYQFHDLPSNASCWWYKCDQAICNTTGGYTFAAYDEEPATGWTPCPSEPDLPKQFFSTVGDACLACISLGVPEGGREGHAGPDLCWSHLCTQELCNATQGWTFEAYDELPAAGWEKCCLFR